MTSLGEVVRTPVSVRDVRKGTTTETSKRKLSNTVTSYEYECKNWHYKKDSWSLFISLYTLSPHVSSIYHFISLHSLFLPSSHSSWIYWVMYVISTRSSTLHPILCLYTFHLYIISFIYILLSSSPLAHFLYLLSHESHLSTPISFVSSRCDNHHPRSNHHAVTFGNNRDICIQLYLTRYYWYLPGCMTPPEAKTCPLLITAKHSHKHLPRNAHLTQLTPPGRHNATFAKFAACVFPCIVISAYCWLPHKSCKTINIFTPPHRHIPSLYYWPALNPFRVGVFNYNDLELNLWKRASKYDPH